MRAGRRGLSVALVAALVLAGCAPTSDPASSAPGARPITTPTATPTATSATPSASPSASCEPVGDTSPLSSSEDWASQLRTEPGDALWGVTMRVAVHDCYERLVFEFAGDGGAPGWSVTPYDASTFPTDGSGEDLSPPLEGTAALDVAFGAWYDGEIIGGDPYGGPLELRPAGTVAIKDVRIVGAFEGITHVGIGLDQPRPYSVMWVDDPARLVIDVSTG